MSTYVPPGFVPLLDFIRETIDRRHEEASDTPRRLRDLQQQYDNTSAEGWGWFDRMAISNGPLPELRVKVQMERSIVSSAVIDTIRQNFVSEKLRTIAIDRSGVPHMISGKFWITYAGGCALRSGRCEESDVLVVLDQDLSDAYFREFDKTFENAEPLHGQPAIEPQETPENAAKAELVKRMLESAVPPRGMTNENLFAELHENYGLSRRAFGRVKGSAIAETKAVAWKKPGPRC